MEISNWTVSTPSWLMVAVAVFVLAGMVKGIVGLGLPTVAMGLLALRMPPAEAAALLIIPSLVTNIWQMRPWGSLGASFSRMWPMQVAICLGTAVGAWLIGAPAGAWANVALGIALVIYAGWALLGAQWRVSPQQERWMGPVVGAITGGVTAGTGVFVIPAVPYLQSLNMQRDELIQTMGLCFTVSTLALAAGLAWNGSFTTGDVGWSAVLLIPAIVGMQIGTWLRSRLSPLWFKRCLMVSLMLLGASMVVR
ncbi:sulfite exporter TauE/SafE family protein [Diaphorobacter aerolatus]|nr:sulfite exporter TauE/SafE family protein [Diaphorobacter aerolatus]